MSGDDLRMARVRAVDAGMLIRDGESDEAIRALSDAVVCLARHLSEPVERRRHLAALAFEDGYQTGAEDMRGERPSSKNTRMINAKAAGLQRRRPGR